MYKLLVYCVILSLLTSCIRAKTEKCAYESSNSEVNSLFEQTKIILEREYKQKVSLTNESYDYRSHFWGSCIVFNRGCGYNLYGDYKLTFILEEYPKVPITINFNDRNCSLNMIC